MTTPGSSEGVSWVDVAASAKGIESQMRAIGAQAAKALSEGMNAALPAQMQSSGRVAATSLTTSLAAGLRELLPASLTTAMRTALETATAASSGAALASGRTLGAEVSEGFASGLGGLGAAMRTELTSAVSGVGSSIRSALSAELGQAAGVGGGALGEQLGGDVASGFRRALAGGGVLLGAGAEGEVSAAGRRLGTTAGTAAAAGLASGLRGGAAAGEADAAGKAWGSALAAGVGAGLGAGSGALGGEMKVVLRRLTDQANAWAAIAPGVKKAGEAAAEEMGKGFNSGLSKLAKLFTPEPLREAVGEMFKGASPKLAEMFAGLSPAMKAGIAGLVILAVDVAVSGIRNFVKLVNTEFAAFEKLGKDAGGALMGSFADIVAGKMPDVEKVIGVGLEGIATAIQLPLNAANTALDSTVGKIPILGGIITSVTGEVSSVLGQAFAAIQDYVGIAGQFGQAILDIGEKWQQAARLIAGQTLGLDQMRDYLGIMRDIAASGDLAHFTDLAEVIGKLGQRLGLTNDQLRELASTLVAGNELLGAKINVDNFAATLTAFGIEADHANEFLTFLINVARESGIAINDLTHDLDASAPAWDAFNYNGEQAAFVMGRLERALGGPALGRFALGFATLEKDLAKANLSLDQYVDIVKDAIKQGPEGEAAARKFTEGLGVSARVAQELVLALKRGVPLALADVTAAMAREGPKLRQPIEEMERATRSLGEQFGTLSSQVLAALAPLGSGLLAALSGVGDKVSAWLKDHQAEFIGWVGAIGEKLLDWGARISHFLAKMLREMSGAVQFTKNAIVVAAMAANAVLITWSETWGMLIPGLHNVAKAAIAAMGPMHDMLKLDIGSWMRTGAAGLDALGNEIEGLEPKLAALVAHSQDAAAMHQAAMAEFAKPGEQAKLQSALSAPPEQGLTIAPAAWDTVVAQYAAQGVTIIGDRVSGQITKITAHTKKELDAAIEYLQTAFGKDKFPEVVQHVAFSVDNLPDTAVKDFLTNRIGVPSELAGDDGIHAKIFLDFKGLPPEQQKILSGLLNAGGPTPGTTAPSAAPSGSGGFDLLHILAQGPSPFSALMRLLGFAHGGTVSGPGGTDMVPIWATAGEKVMNLGASAQFGPVLDWMNAQAFATGGTVADATGIPAAMAGGSGMIALPAGISLVTPLPLSAGDTLSVAGIPDKLQGEVTVAGVSQTGVALPTGLAVKDAGRRAAADVMTAAGIPSNLQSADGVKIDVKLNLMPGDTTLNVAGAAPPGPGGPVADQALQAMLAGGPVGMLAGGFPQSEFAPLSNIIARESSWNPTNTNYTDVNAQRGDNSVGLGQLTLSNYRTYGPFPQVTSVAAAQALTPYQQVSAMTNYIRARYQTPSGAWAHWQGAGNYATGGLVPGGLVAGDYSADDIAGVDAEILGADVIAHQMGLRLTSGKAHHSIDSGYHPKGMAGDFGNGVDTPEETRFASYMASNFGPNIAELIHAGGGWNTDFNIGQGKFIRDWKAQGNSYYSEQTLAEHHDHVHLAMVPGSAAALAGLATTGTIPANWQSTGGGLSFAPTSVSLVSSYGPYGSTGTTAKGALNPVLAGLVQGVMEALGFKLPHPEAFWALAGQDGSAPLLGRPVAGGGHITGYHLPGRDTVPMSVPPGTFIMNRHRSMQYRDILDRMLPMATGGLIPIITEPGERVIPPGTAPPGLLHAMNQGRLLRRQPGGEVDAGTLPPGTKVILVGKGDPNEPKVPEPIGAGAPLQGPIAGWPQPIAPAGAPRPSAAAVETPYGWFLYPMDMPDKGAGLTPDVYRDFTRWLQQAETRARTAADDADAAHKAQTDETDALTALAGAQKAYDDLITKRQHDFPTTWQTEIATDAEVIKAGKDLETARRHETDTSKALRTANEHLHDATVNADAELKQRPPWETRAAEVALTPDQNAAAMGAGLIKGMAQELGFGDVFGKPPWQWGIWKLFAGTASAAIGIGNVLGGRVGGAPGGLPSPAAAGLGQVAPPGAPGAPGGEQIDSTDAITGLPIYKMWDGTLDRPNPDGGYRHSHQSPGGPAWSSAGGFFYPPGFPKKPVTGGAGGDGKPAESKLPALGQNERYDPTSVPGVVQKIRDGAPTGEFYNTGTGARVAAPPGTPPPPGTPAPGLPPQPPGTPGGPPIPVAPHIPSGPGEPGWSGQPPPPAPPPPWRPPPGEEGPLGIQPPVAAPSAFTRDWVMHPARTMLADYRARTGTLPGLGPPRPASEVSSWMQASQPPATAPLGATLMDRAGGNIGTQINLHVNDTPDHVFQGHVQSAVVAGNRAPQLAGGTGVPI
jgi:hypothetical protein